MQRSGGMILVIVLVALGIIILPATFAQSAQKKDAPVGNADNGKKLYVGDGCYECHGRAAQGGSGSGPRLEIGRAHV